MQDVRPDQTVPVSAMMRFNFDPDRPEPMPMTFPSLVFLVALTGLGDAPSPVFTPVAADRLYTEPGADLTLRLRLASGAAANPLAYRVLDYAGNLVNQGRLRPEGPDQWEISLQVVQGFLEIELPSSGQRFGVLCLPAWKGKPDPFFAIDGGLSWLVSDGPSRQSLIAAELKGASTTRRDDPPRHPDTLGRSSLTLAASRPAPARIALWRTISCGTPAVGPGAMRHDRAWIDGAAACARAKSRTGSGE